MDPCSDHQGCEVHCEVVISEDLETHTHRILIVLDSHGSTWIKID